MELICFFCKKAEIDVKKIITYQNTPICYICILKCESLLSEAMNHYLDEDGVQIREETGIPKQYTPSRLTFNSSTQTVILEVVNIPSPNYCSRIYVKRRDEKKYILLEGQEEGLSYSNVISSCNQPYAFFQSSISNRLIYGGGSERLQSFYRVDLRDYKIEKLIDEGELILPKPYVGATPFLFINASDDGNYLYCSCHLKSSDDEVGSFICRLDITTKCLELITELKGVWF